MPCALNETQAFAVNFGPFEAACQALSDKLRPQVFELGFLR